jgi:lysophospholipase L1-like esterase
MGSSVVPPEDDTHIITPNADIVEAGGYNTPEIGAANLGGGDTQRYLMNNSQHSRIRQNGSVTAFRMYFSAKPNVTTFYFQIWRKDGATWDRIGQEDVLSKIANDGTVQTITLTTPIAVQEGDYIGVGYDGGPAAFMHGGAYGTDSLYYNTDETPTEANYAWASKGELGVTIAIDVYMQAPCISFIGDSIMAGHAAHYSYCEAAILSDIDSTIPYNASILFTEFSCTYQNMGIGSETTTSIKNRFTADVVDIKPKYVVIEGGVNDIAAAVEKATVTGNYHTIFAAAQAAGIVPVFLQILPWTGGTNEQMQTRDDWNTDIAADCLSHGGLVVNADSYVGQFRVGGDDGNLWDQQAAYDDGGHIHYTAAGHAKIAEAIYDVIYANL